MGTQTNSLNVFNDEYIKKVLDSLDPEMKKMFLESLSEEQKKMIFSNEEALKNIEENSPYEIVDLASKKPSLPHLTEDIFKLCIENSLSSVEYLISPSQVYLSVFTTKQNSFDSFSVKGNRTRSEERRVGKEC